MSEEIVGDYELKTIANEIYKAFEDLEKAIEERGIVRVEEEYAGGFWGYYLRGYNEKDEEVYTKAVILGKGIPNNDKFRVLAESLFYNMLEALKQLYCV
jgi:hypothetical protein